MAFNQFKRDTEAREKETIEEAVRRAKSPGQQSPGSAASSYGGSTNLVPSSVTHTVGPVDPDTIGIDANGVYWRPFVVGIDYVGEPGAYIPDSNVKYEFGN